MESIKNESPKYVRDCWYVAGLSHEFKPAVLTAHRIAEKSIVIWRTKEGKIAAFDNRCCHKRFPLSEGRFVEEGILECAYHGLCYDERGKCVKIPAHPDGRIPEQARLRPFPVVEQDGLVWIWSGNPERAAQFQPPRTPEIADPKWEAIDSGPIAVPANYLLLIENLLCTTATSATTRTVFCRSSSRRAKPVATAMSSQHVTLPVTSSRLTSSTGFITKSSTASTRTAW